MCCRYVCALVGEGGTQVVHDNKDICAFVNPHEGIESEAQPHRTTAQGILAVVVVLQKVGNWNCNTVVRPAT